jgi:hypothetical protein
VVIGAFLDLVDDLLYDWRCRHLTSPCADCRMDTTPSNWCGARELGSWEWYMVHGRVWEAANADGVEYLCVACLERRLGRLLTPRDFADVNVNQRAVWASDRLIDRMGPVRDPELR